MNGAEMRPGCHHGPGPDLALPVQQGASHPEVRQETEALHWQDMRWGGGLFGHSATTAVLS